MECCGYSVPAWVVEFLEENDFSVRAACIICRLLRVVQCNNALELVSVLVDVAQGRLPLRNCGKRTRAEIAEKIGVTP
jgi:hypothetical protein